MSLLLAAALEGAAGALLLACFFFSERAVFKSPLDLGSRNTFTDNTTR